MNSLGVLARDRVSFPGSFNGLFEGKHSQHFRELKILVMENV